MPSHKSTNAEESTVADTTTNSTSPGINKIRPARPGLIYRGIAFFFDTCFFSFVMLLINLGINQIVADSTTQFWIAASVASILFFLYKFLMDAKARGTLGKAVIGVKVATETGGQLGYTRALKRNFYWLFLGQTLVPGSNHPQLHIGSVSIDPDTILSIWVIALAISVYRNAHSQSFVDRWAGAYFY